VASLTQLRDGLKTRLATISGLRAYAEFPDAVVVPAAIVRPLRGQFRSALSGHPQTAFEVLVLVSMPRLDKAQDALDPYLADTGASSIFAALEGDRTLGGVADDILVGTDDWDWRDYGGVVVNGIEYLSARIDVLIYH